MCYVNLTELVKLSSDEDVCEQYVKYLLKKESLNYKHTEINSLKVLIEELDLDKVLFKGTSEDVWAEQIHRLTDKALITLKLEDGIDGSDIVIVHNVDDGDTFEIIEINSYDPETNTISFYTNSFSNYAIANKISSTTENTKTTDTSSNPTTGDNIIMIISIFAIATFGVFTTLKVNKNRRIRKH